jgi:hypothetical protein
VFGLDADFPAELGPLSWLIGVWEGTGVVNYRIGEDVRNHEFGQRISFSHDGLPHLNYTSYTWLLTETESPAGNMPLITETGYWRLSRNAAASDPGPGMLPATGDAAFSGVEDVERLRNAGGGFDIEVSMVHPSGISELYLGEVKGPRIDLQTDAVMRSASAKEYAAATRLYGLVDSHLLWAWDIAALGQDLRTHASGRLARVD